MLAEWELLEAHGIWSSPVMDFQPLAVAIPLIVCLRQVALNACVQICAKVG